MYCVLLLNLFCTCALFSTAKPQAQWNYGLFPPVKCLSCPMRDARNTALCITSRLPFNYKFVVNVTALVHRNWNVTNLHCICHTSGGENGLFTRVPHKHESWRVSVIHQFWQCGTKNAVNSKLSIGSPKSKRRLDLYSQVNMSLKDQL